MCFSTGQLCVIGGGGQAAVFDEPQKLLGRNKNLRNTTFFPHCEFLSVIEIDWTRVI